MSGYAWVEDLEAFCFTAVVGLQPDDVIRRLGGDPSAAATTRTFEECFWTADGPQWAQVGLVDGGLVVAEHNGWRAEERAARLSEGARLACFFRNVQAVMRFVYAVDGMVLAEFDPLLDKVPTVAGLATAPGPPGAVATPAVSARTGPTASPDLSRAVEPFHRALEGLPFGLFSAEPSALTLLERLTGVRIERHWLDAPQRAVALPPLT